MYAAAKFTLLLVLGIKLYAISAQLDLMKIREWKQLDFNFPNPRTREEAIRKRLFVAQNNFPIDVDVDYNGEKYN
jgi:hypothetical protein